MKQPGDMPTGQSTAIALSTSPTVCDRSWSPPTEARGQFRMDPNFTNLPTVDVDGKAKTEEGDRNGRCGIFINSSETNWGWQTCAPGTYLEGFNNYIKSEVSINGINELANSISSDFESMNTTVFLLAGNVFQYRGLETDSTGKMYSPITY